MNRIAQKLQGDVGDEAKKGKPSGTALERAKDLVAHWQRLGLVQVDRPLKKGQPGLVRRVL